MSTRTKDVPSSIQININDEVYRVFLNIDEITCFICKKPGHIFSKYKNTNSPNTIQLIDEMQTDEFLDEASNQEPDSEIDEANAMQTEPSTAMPDNQIITETPNDTEPVKKWNHKHWSNKYTLL